MYICTYDWVTTYIFKRYTLYTKFIQTVSVYLQVVSVFICNKIYTYKLVYIFFHIRTHFIREKIYNNMIA